MNDQTPFGKPENSGSSEDFAWVEQPLRRALEARPGHQLAKNLAAMAIARWRDRQQRMHANAMKLVRLRKLLGGVTFVAVAVIAMIVWRAAASIESLLQSASVGTTSGTSASTAAAAVQQSSSTTGTLTMLAAWTPTVAGVLMLAGLLLVLRRLFSPDAFNPARAAAWF